MRIGALVVLFVSISLLCIAWDSNTSGILQKKDEIINDTITSPQSKLDLLTHLASQEDVRKYDDSLAIVLHEIAKVLWDLNRGEEALSMDKQALTLRKAYKTVDPENYCRSAYNLALDFETFGMRDSAILYFTEVIAISPRNRQKSKSACNTGEIYKVKGDFALATTYGKDALQWALDSTLHPEIQSAFHLLLEVYNLMLHQDDLTAADSIIAVTSKAKAYYSALEVLTGDSLKKYALTLWYESNAFKYRREYVKAESLLNEAEEHYLQSGVRDEVFESERFNSRGILLRRLKKYDDALKALNKALDMRIELKDSVNVAVTHNNIGDLYLDQQLYPKALRHYHTSIQQIAGRQLSDEITALPASKLLQHHPRLLDAFRYIGFKADAWRQYGKDSGDQSFCNEALRTYDLADSLIDILRAGHLREGSKLFWREDAKRLYAGAMDAAMMVGDDERALYYSDRSKAILVLDAVREHMMRDTPSGRLMEKKDSLQKEIGLLERIGKTSAKWTELTTELGEINASLQQAMPHYSSQMSGLSSLRLSELRKGLNNDEAIIQYFDSPGSRDVFVMPDTIYAFVITRDNVASVGLNKSAIHNALGHYSESNTAFLTKGVAKEVSAGADPLYTLLIKPLGSLPENLTIIPDGAIGQIGFDGLRDEESNYLIESKNIRYDFSMAMAYEMANADQGNSMKVLALAPMTKAICDQDALTFTQNEVNGITSIATGKKLIGRNASKKRLFELSHQYGILHLATHASANTKEPSRSWIALSGDTSTCDFLYVQDLYTRYLPSSMVVVSACEGAHGAYASGEGAMSVARGFVYAGAASVITSLWQVNDAATATIMKSYYGHLADGLTKSKALRQAKLDYIRDPLRKKMELHPAWWSAFIVIGNDAPLTLQEPGHVSWWQLVLPAVVALMVIAFYWWRRKRG